MVPANAARLSGKSTIGWSWVPVLGVLLAALCVRLAGVDFGLPALLDPDELMFELASFRQISQGTANPGWFGHPATTTIYALSIVNVLVFLGGWLGGAFAGIEDFAEAIFADPGILILPGRLVIVGFAVWCVYLVHRLAVRLFDRRAGLLAAGLVALSPVMVSWSQVIRSDVMATAFMLCAMLFALDYLRQPKRRSLVLSAALAGAATATKWPFALTLIAILAAITCTHAARDGGYRQLAGRIALAALAMLASLLLISPFLLLDFGTVMANLEGEAQVSHLGANGYGFFGNLWFYLSDPLLAGLGPFGLAAGIVGAARFKPMREWWIVVGLPLAAFLVLISSQNLVWERWVLPLVPGLAVSAGSALSWMWGRIDQRIDNSLGCRALLAVAALAVALPLLAGVIERYRLRADDPRAVATAWARQNLPAGSSLMVEHFAFDLQSTSFTVLFPVGTAGCLDARDVLAGRMDYARIDALRGGNSNMDYAAVPAEMRATCGADYALVSEYTRYLEEADLYPEKVAAYRELVERADIVCTFEASSSAEQRSKVYLLQLRGRDAGLGRSQALGPARCQPQG